MKAIPFTGAAFFLFVCSLALTTFPAHAERFSTSAGDYEVTTVTGMFDDPALASTLASQIWWDDPELAHEFAALVTDSLGVLSGNFEIGPIFAYTTEIPPEGEVFGWDVGGAAWCGAGTELFCIGTDTFFNPGYVDGFYAIAHPVSLEDILSGLQDLVDSTGNFSLIRYMRHLLFLKKSAAHSVVITTKRMLSFCNVVEALRYSSLADSDAEALKAIANDVILFLDDTAALCP